MYICQPSYFHKVNKKRGKEEMKRIKKQVDAGSREEEEETKMSRTGNKSIQ